MPETTRECSVVLLDETSFTVPVKPTLLANELLDMAASHCKVKEKEYFGFFVEGEDHKNWLELDKPVLDPCQDIPKGTQPVKIYFTFKYFVDDLRYFQDCMTVELLYLQSRQAIMKGEIQTDDATIFELAACAMQAQHGDYRSEVEALQHLKLLPCLPAHVFRTNSIEYSEREVIRYYKMMQNLSRGEAIFKYLEIIQSLPMYSMHYFEVRDKKDIMMWLGVGPDGISICPSEDRNEAESRYQWLQLQNIYYRDRKFSMEVYQNPKPGKKGVGFGPVVVLAWHGSNSKVVMAIWKMARDQHMFYRSKRANKSPHLGMNTSEIIRQLSKLHHTNVSPSSSQSSLSMESARSNQTQASAEAMAAAKAAQHEMYSALLARRSALVADFEKKASRYKEILIKEMQITGIPPQGLTAEEIERMRKKFGVSYKFSKYVLNDSATPDDAVEELEKHLEVQLSIIEASKNLLDQTQNRRLRKDRKKDIKHAEDKLQQLEDKLQDLKRIKRGSTSSAGSAKFHVESPATLQVPGSIPTSRKRCNTPSGSVDDTYIASIVFNTPRSKSPSSLQRSPHHKSTSALTDLQSQPGNQSQYQPPAQRHTPTTSSHSVYSKQSFSSDRSFTSDYPPSFLSSVGFNDDFDTSPPSSVISTNTSVLSHGPRHGGNVLRDFDLTEEYLQHFARDNCSPQPGKSSQMFSPRQPNVNQGLGFNFPTSSSPIPRNHRSSTPDINFPVETRGGYPVPGVSHGLTRHGSSSPDLYLPAPNLQPYPSSYQPPSNFPPRQTFTNPQGPRPKQPGYQATPPGHWYDNDPECGGYPHDVNYQPPGSHGNIMPGRKQSEESYDLHEMLKIWHESKQNPFGEGTLV